MYETPKLIRFGSFRDLTLQTVGCPGIPSNQKNTNIVDPAFGPGAGTVDDGCPVARS